MADDENMNDAGSEDVLPDDDGGENVTESEGAGDTEESEEESDEEPEGTDDTEELPIGNPQGFRVTEQWWGPEHPGFNNDLDQFPTADYLIRYANKIRMDLVRVGRMYNARRIRVYRPKETARCSYCTNQITGEVMLTNCPICKGTGRTGGWDILCECYAYGDIGGKYHIATSEGTSEASGGNRDQFIIVGTDILLRDQDWFAFIGNRDCYKVYDTEPFMITMQGTVIGQVVNASGLTPMSTEFKQIDW